MLIWQAVVTLTFASGLLNLKQTLAFSVGSCYNRPKTTEVLGVTA
jgi:hypothetical protein